MSAVELSERERALIFGMIERRVTAFNDSLSGGGAVSAASRGEYDTIRSMRKERDELIAISNKL